MKKSVIAILMSIMMITGSIGAVPVIAAQPPAAQEAADLLAEEYGFSPESGLSAGEDSVLVDESVVVETGTNAAEDAAEEQPGQPAEEQMAGPSEEQPGQPAEEQTIEPVEEQPEQPAEEQTIEPVEEQTEEPVEEQVEEPSEEQIEQPAGEQSEEPAEEQVEEPSEEQIEQPAGEQSEEPAEEQMEQPAEEQTEVPAGEQVEEPAEEQVEEPFEDQAEQAAEDENAGEPAGTRSGSIESPADESITDGDVGEDIREDAVQEEIPVPEELEQSEAMNDGGDAAGDDQVKSGSFAELQQMIDDCEIGGSITLDRNYKAGPEEKALDLGSEGLKNITIYLNGKTIDRGLAEKAAVNNGYVFLVHNMSTLELCGPGTITGGNNTGDGGGIFFEGYASYVWLKKGVVISGNKAENGAGIYATGSPTANLWIENGATISGNTANNAGGGVYVDSNFDGLLMYNGSSITGNTADTASAVYVGEGAEFNLSGGNITGNIATDGPAVYLADTSTFTIYGSPVIKDNTSGSRSYNVYVPANNLISVLPVLYNAEIGVSTSAEPADDTPVIFTSGLASGGDASSFFSDSYYYQVVSTTEGEAALSVRPETAYNIEIGEYEHGSVSTEYLKVYPGDPVTLTVTPDADYALATLTATYISGDGGQQETIPLDGPLWDEDTGKYIASFTMPAADVTVDAAFIYTGPWKELRGLLSAGGTVTLTKSYTAYLGAQPLEIPDGVSVTLDLNGYDIDRGLADLEAQADGSVIVNNGTLVIKNSGSGSGGNITGGNTVGGGGGIINYGTMTLESGNITGNKAGNSGGGIYNINTGTLTITGGSISQNTAVSLHGGGIYNAGTLTLSGGRIQDNEAQSGDSQGGGILQNGTMNVSGNPIVNCNTAQRGGNIYLRENHTTMNVTGPFTEGASLYVTKANGTGVITSGYGTYHNESPEEYFTAIGYRIITNDGSREAEIVNSDDVVDYYERSWVNNTVSSTLKAHNAKPVPNSILGFSGWYYLDRDVTINGRVDLNGDTYLILGDGFTFDVKGLYIPQGSTLTVYSQSDGDNAGKIISHPGSVQGGAAIGGYSGNDNGNIVIHGGNIEARGYDHCAGIGTNDGKTGGDITIYGGKIKAIGGSDGAGIGGGRNCDGGNITIYGGEIIANGPTDSDCCENGAGIGGGDCGDGGLINIYGGTIQTYSRDGAGIGGGDDGDGGNITINGGTITSTKVNQGQGARIGGGCDGAPGKITISGGTITTEGGSGAGIGGGKGNKSGGTVTITGGVINASGSYGIGAGEDGSSVATTLGYTAATRDDISITASSYAGTVTLEQPFTNGTQDLKPGGVTDLSLLANKTLTAWIPVVTIKGVTGSFNDKIKLNYYFSIPQILLSDQNAYVTLTNEKTGNSKTLYIKEAEYVEGKGHKFSILLAAKEASDTISAKVFDGQGSPATIRGNLRDNDYTETGVRYTLMRYLDWLADEGETDKEKALGTAVKDYCAAAQIYFNYNADGLKLSSAVGAVTNDTLSSYIASRSGTLPSGVSIRGISAMLESDNTLRLYLGFKDVEPSSFTYKISGQSTEIKTRSDGAYYLALDSGVYSNHLQDECTYSISDGTNTYTITMSVLTYARSCAIKTIEEESNLGKALYLYNQAATAMFGQ